MNYAKNLGLLLSLESFHEALSKERCELEPHLKTVIICAKFHEASFQESGFWFQVYRKKGHRDQFSGTGSTKIAL
jgi:hypothetical protein